MPTFEKIPRIERNVPLIPKIGTSLLPKIDPGDQKLRELSTKLEATFLAEMLKASGFGKAREGMGGGGIGEAQFGSFMVQNHAENLAQTHGIGLAEHFFNSLKGKE